VKLRLALRQHVLCFHELFYVGLLVRGSVRYSTRREVHARQTNTIWQLARTHCQHNLFYCRKHVNNSWQWSASALSPGHYGIWNSVSSRSRRSPGAWSSQIAFVGLFITPRPLFFDACNASLLSSTAWITAPIFIEIIYIIQSVTIHGAILPPDMSTTSHVSQVVVPHRLKTVHTQTVLYDVERQR